MYIFITRNNHQCSEKRINQVGLQTCKYHPDTLLLRSLGTPCKPFLEISRSVPHFLDLDDLEKTPLYIVIPVLGKTD